MMKYLVFCTCGHALDQHGEGGCAGESGRGCACVRDPGRALEAAVDDVRSRPWAAEPIAQADA
jgi:hypothetical protein